MNNKELIIKALCQETNFPMLLASSIFFIYKVTPIRMGPHVLPLLVISIDGGDSF
jgi:hypothetical protein